MAEAGNGNGGRNGPLASIKRVAEGIAIGVGAAALIAIGSMSISMRDDISETRSAIAVMRALQEQQLAELTRRVNAMEARMDRINPGAFR